jgi:hypothetical protein
VQTKRAEQIIDRIVSGREAAGQIERKCHSMATAPSCVAAEGLSYEILTEDIDGAGNTTQAERLEKKRSAVGSAAGDNWWAATECRAYGHIRQAESAGRELSHGIAARSASKHLLT